MADPAVMRIRARYGLQVKLAKHLGVSDRAVYRWETVPLEHVFHVAKITGIPPEQLRPDFFINDPLRAELAEKALAGPVPPARREYTQAHRAIWLDIRNYPTDRDAIQAIAATLGRYPAVSHLRAKFGAPGRPNPAATSPGLPTSRRLKPQQQPSAAQP